MGTIAICNIYWGFRWDGVINTGTRETLRHCGSFRLASTCSRYLTVINVVIMNATWTWTTYNGTFLYKIALPDLSALDAGCCLNLMVTCRKETFVKATQSNRHDKESEY